MLSKYLPLVFARKRSAPNLSASTESTEPGVSLDTTPWRRGDSALGLAIVFPWLAMNCVYMEWFARLWFGGGLLVYLGVLLVAVLLLTGRDHRHWTDLAVGIGIVTPWTAFALFGPRWFVVPVVWWGFYLFQTAVLLFVPWWLARKRKGNRPWARIPMKRYFREAVIALPVLALMLALIWGSNYLWRLSQLGAGIRWTTWLDATKVGGPMAMFALMLLSFTLVPIAEETFFRGFLYNAMSRSLSRPIAWAVQGFLFAAIHPRGFIGLLTLGLILGALYTWRKTLLTPILIHAGHNIVFAAYFTAMLVNLVFTPIFGIHGDDQSGRIVVTHVRPLATADRAGLQEDDVVVQFDGVPVNNIDVLHQQVKAKRVGQHVPVVVLRDGRPITLDVVMYNRFTSPAEEEQDLATDE